MMSANSSCLTGHHLPASAVSRSLAPAQLFAIPFGVLLSADFPYGDTLRQFYDPNEDFVDFTISPDSQTLATLGIHGSVLLWNLASKP